MTLALECGVAAETAVAEGADAINGVLRRNSETKSSLKITRDRRRWPRKPL